MPFPLAIHHPPLPRKNGYLAVFSPENDYIEDFLTQEASYIVVLTPFKANSPPQKDYFIAEFFYFFYSDTVYGRLFAIPETTLITRTEKY